jgi:hypothetical protein
MGIEQLENKGFAFLNPQNVNTEKRQIVVVGSARGGTSIVAGALYKLGIFTGDKSNAPVFEDILLSDAFEKNELDGAKEIVVRYTEEHDVWAWKRPAALNYLDIVDEIIPNPFYIFIFKDIFAIANRNNISMQADIGKGLQNALVDYSKIVEFISKTQKPTMLVSAEKALQNKASFVNALVEMNKGIIDLSENSPKAIEFITANPKEYLDETRNTKATGSVDYISFDKLSGWATLVHSDKFAVIEVYVDGNLCTTAVADEFRIDLLEKGVSINGKCSFNIDLTRFDIKRGSLVEVKVAGDVSLIKNGGKYV